VEIEGEVYEVRLSSGRGGGIQFVTVSPNDDTAEKYARALLARFPEYAHAEVWRGMALVKEIVIGERPGRA
jgi:hypothetical protein